MSRLSRGDSPWQDGGRQVALPPSVPTDAAAAPEVVVMTDTHWFDRLHRTLMLDASRRGALGTAMALAAALVIGEPRVSEARRNKKKRRKNKKKDKPPCSGGACAAVPEWAGNREQIAFCETKCARCRDRIKFCIVAYPEPTRATCCFDDQECCPVFLDDAFIGEVCLPNDRTCCPDDPKGVCLKASPERTCCPGVGCVDTKTDTNHCGGCTRLCAVNERCCDGACADTTTDPEHCGQCTRLCAVDQQCVDSDCVDGDGDVDCEYPLIPNPCPHLPVEGGCVADQNIVCCEDFSCIVSGNPEDYACCGRATEHPIYGCRQSGETCLVDPDYPPLATHCRRGDPVCGG